MPCTTILVGKKASYDGSTLIARNDDGGFEAKKTVIIDTNKAPKKYKTVISETEIELPDFSYRYTSHPSVTPAHGLWPACGINEYNVGMNATETTSSNPLVEGADPLCEKKNKKGKTIPSGIGEEDLLTIVLPYIKTAREGVIRLGELLEKYGTYERNGLAFNDDNEVWWFESIGGHHFIARKVKDDEMVIMPNQFGLDRFDFDDAYGEAKENICSKDLLEFMNKNHINLNINGDFNPRLAFGSHTDLDHIYNTPRSWFMLKYFAPSLFKEGNYTPTSDDIPWAFKPDHKVTIQEMKFALSSYYQDTEFNPYGKEAKHGKYRSIGVPNTDVCGLEQIRGYMDDKLKGVEWTSFGGGAFTCMFPQYTSVKKVPNYIGKVTPGVSTNNMYWTSRLIAALTDAHFAKAIIFIDRYQNEVFNKCYKILDEYDHKYLDSKNDALLEEANQKICDMVEEISIKILGHVLATASNSMKTRYNREDN